MVTTVKRKPERPVRLGTLGAKVFQWATLKHEVKVLGTEQARLRDDLLEFIATNGEMDEKGSQFVTLPDKIIVGNDRIGVIKRERRASVYLDVEAAESFLGEKKLLDRCQKEVTTIEFDQDELYVLNQEGLITDAELDALFKTAVTFAFKPLVD
jgi:hypothetical protein